MSLTAQLCDLYNRCVPENYRVAEEAFDGLGGTAWTEYDGDRLIGCALLRKHSLTLLCVDPLYRNCGIGSSLLNRAEEAARMQMGDSGMLTLGYGSDYILQGLPDEDGFRGFFEKRGYVFTGYTWDMTAELPLNRFPAPDRVRFRLTPVNGDVLNAVKAVDPSWLGVYETTDEDVLLAEWDGKTAGFCIPSCYTRFLRDRSAGSVSCVGVLPEYRNRGIGRAMVSAAGAYLYEEGCTVTEILHTYVPEWYEKLGFASMHRLLMGGKKL